MDDSLIKTKLFRPKLSTFVVDRVRLNSILDEKYRKRLNVVVAPAGYGKSTTLSHWYEMLESNDTPCCWVTLDSEDNDPTRFLRYLITSLQQLHPDLGAPILQQLRSGGQVSYETMLATLVNQFEQYQGPLCIFLDDYHCITDEAIDNMVLWLIQYAPDDIMFCLASRNSPKLSLNTLKVSGQLQLISAEELNFSTQETATLFKGQLDIKISDELIESLTQKTEGWIAAIQLASLALRGQNDAQEIIEGFSGADRDITDYLGEVVLARQPAEIKDFLLRTASLHRLSAPLCNAVLGINNSQSLLEKLEDANLFLIQLDRQRRWYRFHHLFRDFLLSTYCQDNGQEYQRNLVRAAHWCSDNQHSREAVRYAFEAKDYSLAAKEISSICEALVLYKGELHTLMDWMKILPAAHVDAWPRIRYSHAWSLLFTRHFEEAQKELDLLDDYCNQHEAQAEDNIDITVLEIRCATETCRCAINCILDDTEASHRTSTRWLQEFTDAPPLFTASVNCAYAYSTLTNFEFDIGELAAADAIRQSRMANAWYPLAWARAIWGMIRTSRGDFNGAMKLYDEGIKENDEKLGPYSFTGSLLSILRSEVLYEQNRLEEASAQLGDSIEFMENEGVMETTFAGCMTLSRLYETRGDIKGAMESLRLGEEAGHRFNIPRLVKTLAVSQIELALRHDEIDDAYRLIEVHQLTPGSHFFNSDTRAVSRELFLQVNTSLAFAEGRFKDVINQCTPIIASNRKSGCTRRELEYLIRKSSAQWLLGELESALRTFIQALEIGASGGFFRTFVDAGPASEEMLIQVYERLSTTSQDPTGVGFPVKFVQQLVQASERLPSPSIDSTNVDVQLESPLQNLTKREMQILDLLSSGCSNRELGDQLFISEQTIKWHLHKIYGKLGAKNRTGAMAQAKRFALI